MPSRNNKSGAQNSGTHTPTGPCKTGNKKSNHLCVDCSTDLDNSKVKSIQCDVCETWFCLKCSKVKGSAFDAISEDPNILWTCVHCNIALPGLKKVLSKLTSFEERFEKMERQIESMQKGNDHRDVNNNNVGGSVQQAVQDVLLEEREIEKRRLNIIIHGLQESQGSEDICKEADGGKVDDIVNEKLSCNVVLDSYERIGKNFEGRKNPRPIRLVVKTFDDKRKILDSSKKLKNDVDMSNIYISPDLTKRQREQSYRLRQEKREREGKGETGLVIRRGKIVKAPNHADHSYSGVVKGPAAATEASSGASFQG